MTTFLVKRTIMIMPYVAISGMLFSMGYSISNSWQWWVLNACVGIIDIVSGW